MHFQKRLYEHYHCESIIGQCQQAHTDVVTRSLTTSAAAAIAVLKEKTASIDCLDIMPYIQKLNSLFNMDASLHVTVCVFSGTLKSRLLTDMCGRLTFSISSTS